MSLEYLNSAVVSVGPASIEGWIRVRIDFGVSIVLVSGDALDSLDILLDENGVAL